MSFHQGNIKAANVQTCSAQLDALHHLKGDTAVLAFAKGLDRGIVVQEDKFGQISKSAVVSLSTLHALSDAGYITPDDPSQKIVRYRITQLGRDLLIHQTLPNPDTGTLKAHPKRCNYGRGESILSNLARRANRNGEPFLNSELVKCGERLKESFEIARLSHNMPTTWGETYKAAQQKKLASQLHRFLDPLIAVGPGLADVLLGCCCFEEGLEDFEDRHGWSSRSGKIVLRIALQRLKLHYDANPDDSAMIG